MGIVPCPLTIVEQLTIGTANTRRFGVPDGKL
jgi:hypothetical protein